MVSVPDSSMWGAIISKKAFVCVSRIWHSAAPEKPGEPGIFFTDVPDLDRITGAQSFPLFTGLSSDEYRYMGDYEQRPARAFTAAEWALLPNPVSIET